MKKYIAWLLMLCIVLLCACSGKPETQDSAAPEASESAQTETTEAPQESQMQSEQTGVSQNYGQLPENYTPEQALADGCLVLTWDEGAVTPTIAGMEYWEDFLEATAQDVEEANLRVVYFQSGIYYYSDLTYMQGYFSMYTLNEFQNYESAIGTYRYIKRIEGLELNTGNMVCYYVLTDIEDLSSEDVLSSARICDIEAERGVPYEPIPFTQYLYLD